MGRGESAERPDNMLMPLAPAEPGANSSLPLHKTCDCGGSLTLWWRDNVIGTDAVIQGDIDSLVRCELVSFDPTGEMTFEEFDSSDDWDLQCDDCGDEFYANMA